MQRYVRRGERRAGGGGGGGGEDERGEEGDIGVKSNPVRRSVADLYKSITPWTCPGRLRTPKTAAGMRLYLPQINVQQEYL